ncbi:hypothetical protein SEA_WHITNEY_85 [Gordonia phage Whitney]|nr:hypothetical protein SEA_WHITNEY_85 [Gordonia phage Whitney]
MSDKWPLKYRIAKRAHGHVNWVHNHTGRHRVTWWLNCKVGSLWINWWIDRALGRSEAEQ